MLTTNGLVDSRGTPAFQTFALPSDFSNLTHVDIPTDLYAIDNVVLNLYPVPEVTTAVQVLLGLLGIQLQRRFRAR